MAEKLTIKEERFAQNYVLLGNASEAYRRSYDASGMKDESIHVCACKVLKKAKVALRVKQLQAQNAAKYEITFESMTKKILRAMQDFERPDEKDPTKVANPHGLISAAMQAARLNGLLIKQDTPISPNFTRMGDVVINGVVHNWGVGEEPKG